MLVSALCLRAKLHDIQTDVESHKMDSSITPTTAYDPKPTTCTISNFSFQK